MAEKGKFETAEKTLRTAYSKFGVVSVVIGLFALLAAVVSLIVVIPAEKTEVAAQVLASDELTTYHPELEAKFTYAGEEVTYLWKLKVKFVNSGDKTIVGVGSQKNILDDGLNFVFPDNTRILRIEEEADTFDSTIVQPKPNHCQIQFSQWRSGEYSIVSFCVASDKPLDVDPFPTVPTRDIVDGDMVIQDLTEKRPEERMFVIDRLPGAISTPGKVIGGFIAGALAIVLLAMVGTEWKPALRLKKWKTDHLASFLKYLDQVEPPLSDKDKQRFEKRPYRLPDALWANFKGEKVPVENPMFDSITQAIVFTVTSFFIVFGCGSLILMLIPA